MQRDTLDIHQIKFFFFCMSEEMIILSNRRRLYLHVFVKISRLQY